MLTKIARFGRMMKVSINKAWVHVAMQNKQEGSVLKGMVKVGCLVLKPAWSWSRKSHRSEWRSSAKCGEWLLHPAGTAGAGDCYKHRD